MMKNNAFILRRVQTNCEIFYSIWKKSWEVLIIQNDYFDHMRYICRHIWNYWTTEKCF